MTHGVSFTNFSHKRTDWKINTIIAERQKEWTGISESCIPG